MPQYLDHHPTIPNLPPEAPSPEAVRRSHQALGIDLDPQDVAEVQVLP